MNKKIILASTSRYRKELLSKLRFEFEQVKPDVEETYIDGELPQDTVVRLSLEKARAVAKKNPQAWVIGSDQIGFIEGKRLTKAGNFSAAKEQLAQQSGKVVEFYTGIALVHAATATELTDCDVTEVEFRELTSEEIEEYLHQEEPYDCAGSFKSEGLGITLFSAIRSQDPSALVGLPLIKLCQLLRCN